MHTLHWKIWPRKIPGIPQGKVFLGNESILFSNCLKNRSNFESPLELGSMSSTVIHM